MRELLAAVPPKAEPQRAFLGTEPKSLLGSLMAHPEGTNLSLRGAGELLMNPVIGDGRKAGCRASGDIVVTMKVAGIDVKSKEMGMVVPSWVDAANSSPRDHRDKPQRSVTGVLVKSKITHTDFPLKPWHTYYDWNYFVQVDPQYQRLLSASNWYDHDRLFECEWDTAFLPEWAWPQVDDRIWMTGRWIFDCGHPDDHGYKTEIHPPSAVASFRSEAVQFKGQSGLARANNAVLYIGRQGGYWNGDIRRSYSFDIPLPPRPDASSEVKTKVSPKTGTLPVQPVLAPYPSDRPGAVRVTIPLEAVSSRVSEYGAIVSVGWSDPSGKEATKIRRRRVLIKRVVRGKSHEPGPGSSEWYLYVGINGRWRVFVKPSWSPAPIAEFGQLAQGAALNYSVTLDLHDTDRVHVTACGFEADPVHDLMGTSTAVPHRVVGTHGSRDEAANAAAKAAATIASNLGSAFQGALGELGLGGDPENDPLGLISAYQRPDATGTHIAISSDRDYLLEYTIS